MLAAINNVTFEFGARTIVQDAIWHIHPGERIGLIGYNGTGKSTLLKLLVGEYRPSFGTVEKGRDTTIGYLHQDLLGFDTNESILDLAMGAFERVRELEKNILLLGQRLEKEEAHVSEKDHEKLLQEYADMLHEMDVLDGYNIQHRAEQVLQGLGFSPDQLNRPYQTFSGGWRMRVLLARMILQQPSLLLLDEPTNHLDLPSIEWLEKYLQHYKGSVVIVSHDRYFLNRMVTKIVELYQQELHMYSGDYDFYESEKEIRIQLQQRAYENQQDYIRQQERFIERFKAKASKAAAAQSAIKKLNKIERIEQAEIERPNLKINFRVDKTPGKIVVTLKNVSKSFGEQVILKETSVEIDRGDKIALIGANGKGKSTMLRIIAGTEPINGERIDGHNVEAGFYAQHQLENLNLEHSVLEELLYSGSGKTEQELRNVLGCFLFSGDDSDKKIKVLSGGEKARVALAKVIISKANFLLLDEPTNHLDMHSVGLLSDALNKYEGTYILVSHDRYFIDRTANKIWEIEDGTIKEFKGTYQEFVDWNARVAKRREQDKSTLPQQVASLKSLQPAKESLQERELNKEKQRVKKLFEKAEEKLEKLTLEKESLSIELSRPEVYVDSKRFKELEKKLHELEVNIQLQNEEYEELFTRMIESNN
jgi:ATP-binding cassette subfamily F protein 3